MIIRETPKNAKEYIIVDSITSNILHKNGFHPKYMDNNFVYYVRSNEIIDFMLKEDLQCKSI